ncbi:MAG: topology modulation protein [Xanthobacteraceae bacterium]
MRRVMVVGCAGAGKTTLARKLAQALSLPLIHLDFYYWRPGWQLPASGEWREQIIALAAAPEWIMDGNYSNTYDVRMPRADALVWLDYARSVCLRRVLLRTLAGYGRTRPDLPESCPERFDISFMRYVWDFPEKHRPRIVARIERFGGHLRIARLGNDRDAHEFLATFGSD